MKRHLICVIIFLSCINMSHADRLTPEQVADAILVDCPAIKSLRSVNEAAALELATESNLPDPELEGEFLAAPKGEENRWGAGISWGIDWPGVYSARKEKARGEIARLSAGEKVAYKETRNEIRRLILDYILQANKIEVFRIISLTNDTLADLTVKANRGGELTLLDLNKVRLETASQNVRLSSLVSEQEATISRLSVIAGKDCRPLLSEMECIFPETEIISENELRERLLTSAEMGMANADIETAVIKKNMTKMERLPSLTIGYRHAFEDGNHFNGGSIGLSVPIFSGKGKGKAAKAAIEAARITAEQVKAENEASGLAALRRLHYLIKEISAIAPILDSTDSQTLLLKAYKGGVITLTDYLNERNYYTEANLQLLEMRHEAANVWLDILSLTN